jgi:hypothetical protein
MKQALSLILCLLCIGAVSVVMSQANQTDLQQKTAKTAAKIKKLGTGDSARVKLTLYNGVKHEGFVKSSTDADFVLTSKAGTEHTIAYSDIRSIGGSGLSKGAKIGIGVGAAAGATLLVIYLAFKHVTRNN